MPMKGTVNDTFTVPFVFSLGGRLELGARYKPPCGHQEVIGSG